MKYKLRLLFLLFLLILLGGCSNNVFENNATITSIEIVKFVSNSPSPEEYSNEDGEVISVITSKEEIKLIINAIERAESESLENANIALPNYLLIFKKDEQKIKSLGYYSDIVNSKDYFFDLSEDKIYKTSALNIIEQDEVE